MFQQQFNQGPPPQPNYWKGLMYECMLPHAKSIHEHTGTIPELQTKFDSVATDVTALIEKLIDENEFILSHQGRVIRGIKITVDNNKQPHVSIY